MPGAGAVAITPGALQLPLHPTIPVSIEETGLSVELITDLVIKALHGVSGLSGSDLVRRIGLSFALLEPILDDLKARRYCEVIGGAVLGGPAFHYRLADVGHLRAVSLLERNHYSGLAPVPVEQYVRYTTEFQKTIPPSATKDTVRDALAHLVVSDRILDEIGPAVNSRRSIFIYGPAGNGKTEIAKAIRSLLPGTLAIPSALEVGGNIIRFFDPTVHEPVAPPRDDENVRYDRRWIQCRRPMAMVGGELTMEALSLAYNPRTGIYRAPVQALTNGGIFLIDEFGRQRCPPRALLNLWMVPFESGVEYLTLQSGEKLEMPFHSLVIFATNLKPSDLVDEAFLRRIQYKIYAENPTPEQFGRIFQLYCTERGVPFESALVEYLLDGVYRSRRIEPRGCHPRDLIDQALSLADYNGQARRLTTELLDEACRSYFLDDRSTPR